MSDLERYVKETLLGAPSPEPPSQPGEPTLFDQAMEIACKYGSGDTDPRIWWENVGPMITEILALRATSRPPLAAPSEPTGDAHRAAREVLIESGFGKMEAHVLRTALRAAYAVDFPAVRSEEPEAPEVSETCMCVRCLRAREALAARPRGETDPLNPPPSTGVSS